MNHLRLEKGKRTEDNKFKDVKNFFRLKKLLMTPQLKI